MDIMNNLEKLVDGIFECNSCEIISMFLLLIIVILLYNMFICGSKNGGGGSGHRHHNSDNTRNNYNSLGGAGCSSSKEPKYGGGNKKTLIFYYVDWCGHCKNFKDTWAKLEQNEKLLKTVNLEKINCEEQEDIAKEEGIEGFPTIKLYVDNKVLDYEGDRTEQSLINFVNQN